MRLILSITVFILSFAGISCRKEKQEATRSFYMGVTPWPADFTVAEVDSAYRFTEQYCDIISQHIDDGIPWEEALTGSLWPVDFQNDINYRKSRTPAGKNVFLSVSALNLTRKEKSDYHSTSTVSTAIKDAWKARSFSAPETIEAYKNYLVRLIDHFDPLYVNFGVESNLLTWDPAAFAQYKTFIATLYPVLKARYPSKLFMVSFLVDESVSGFEYAKQLLPYTDCVALSSYPYVAVSSSTSGNTNPSLFPANYFERFYNMAPVKPLVFAETGYLAEPLSIPGLSFNKQGTALWQQQYLERILNDCQSRKALLLIWFCAKDYNAGIARMKSLGLYQDLFSLWEDTGLKDENGAARPALRSWENWFKRKRIN